MGLQLRWLVPKEATTNPPILQMKLVNGIGQVLIDWRDVPTVVDESDSGNAPKLDTFYEGGGTGHDLAI